MSPTRSNRYAPVLFGMAGILFLMAGYFADNIAFYGVGAMFCIFAASGLFRKKNPGAKSAD